jgi:hypothetical protein
MSELESHEKTRNVRKSKKTPTIIFASSLGRWKRECETFFLAIQK